MKRILSAIVLLAALYMIAADGLMTHFSLAQSAQYTFNLGAVVLIFPFCMYFLQGMDAKEAES